VARAVVGSAYRAKSSSAPAARNIWFVTSLALCTGWTIWGVTLFATNSWTVGELGDFFGGGLGGFAILAILYTAKIQAEQLRLQQLDTEEAGVLRTFETLKPELEGLSMRIVSKLAKAGLVGLTSSEFQKMAIKYREDGDRTVFLRFMRRMQLNNLAEVTQPEPAEAIRRFIVMMNLIKVALDKIESKKPDDSDFCEAIRSTELYQCFIKVFLS